MKKNMLILIGLMIAASGMGLMFVNMATLTVYCDSPYGTYDCTPYVPPPDPCINVTYCNLTTTSTAYTTSTTTVINKVTSTQTFTNTVTDIKAVYVTTTVTTSTVSKVTSTKTLTNTVTDLVARYSTTTITVNDQLSTITQTVTDNSVTTNSLPLNVIGISMMLIGSGTMIIGVKKK